MIPRCPHIECGKCKCLRFISSLPITMIIINCHLQVRSTLYTHLSQFFDGIRNNSPGQIGRLNVYSFLRLLIASKNPRPRFTAIVSHVTNGSGSLRSMYFSNTPKEHSTVMLLCPFTNEYMSDFAFSSIFLVIILNNIGANRLISVRSASLFLCSFSSSISSGVRLMLDRCSENKGMPIPPPSLFPHCVLRILLRLRRSYSSRSPFRSRSFFLTARRSVRNSFTVLRYPCISLLSGSISKA